jgi:hypothetical protein
MSVSSDAITTLKAGDFLPVVVYNSLGWSRNEFVSILAQRADLSVVDDQGQAVDSQVNPIANFSYDIGINTHRLFFHVSVPALGTRTYFIKVDAGAVQGVVSKGVANITGSHYRLSFSPSTSRLAGITNIVTGASRSVAQDYYQYVSASQVIQALNVNIDYLFFEGEV